MQVKNNELADKSIVDSECCWIHMYWLTKGYPQISPSINTAEMKQIYSSEQKVCLISTAQMKQNIF